LTLQSAEDRYDSLRRLTSQERECLRLVAEQRSSKEIALALGIAKASVDTYCNRARAKLGVASRREAARMVAAQLEAAAVPREAQQASAFLPEAADAGRVAAPASFVAKLGPLRRLGVILMGASLFALAFGVLDNGLQSLNDVVATAQIHVASSSVR
jgi:DNA-binding CsgD family transcriptional regulator